MCQFYLSIRINNCFLYQMSWETLVLPTSWYAALNLCWACSRMLTEEYYIYFYFSQLVIRYCPLWNLHTGWHTLSRNGRSSCYWQDTGRISHGTTWRLPYWYVRVYSLLKSNVYLYNPWRNVSIILTQVLVASRGIKVDLVEIKLSLTKIVLNTSFKNSKLRSK